MSRRERRKSKVKSGYGFDDAANEKQQGMLMSIISGNKGIVKIVLFILLFQIVTNILTWLLTFKLI